MKWILRLFLLILLLFGWGVVGYYYVDYTLESPKRDKAIEVEIPEKTSIKQIGKILEENGLIRDSTFFSFYAEYKHFTNLRAGIYLIEPTENLDEILTKFKEGKQNLVKITVPEGATVFDIAEKLREKGFDKEGFLKECNRPPGKFAFEQQIPNNTGRAFRLEGYLFPSTYFFRKDATPEEIVDMMLGEFDKKMRENHIYDELKHSNYTLDQIIIIASLIEREGQVRKELPIIAGVIYNRLKSHMPLQIDASVAYAILMVEGVKRKPTKKDIELNHPYNTYKIGRLPPGAISNPGIDAILAALHPMKHNYLYYVVKGDGSGEHYFASNWKQHLENVRKSNQNNRNR
jgi:UPF0755 protein